jgi:hypothetical protein
MAPQPRTLGTDIIDKLEEVLPEFRDGGKNTRKSIIDRLAQETLPEGSNGQKHKKVWSCLASGLYNIFHSLNASLFSQ